MPARAKLPPGGGKRFPLNMRTTREMREKLEKSAGGSGRSLVQEVEYLMEQALREEEVLGGRERYALFKMMSAATDLIEARTGKSAASDWETSLAVREAWKKLIAAWAPKMSETQKAKFRALDEGQRSLPPPPSPPQEPLGLLGHDLMQQDKKASAEYKKAHAKYAKDIQKWRRLMGAYRKKLERQREYIDGLAGMGKEAALDLLRHVPPRDR